MLSVTRGRPRDQVRRGAMAPWPAAPIGSRGPARLLSEYAGPDPGRFAPSPPVPLRGLARRLARALSVLAAVLALALVVVAVTIVVPTLRAAHGSGRPTSTSLAPASLAPPTARHTPRRARERATGWGARAHRGTMAAPGASLHRRHAGRADGPAASSAWGRRGTALCSAAPEVAAARRCAPHPPRALRHRGQGSAG